MTAGIGHRHSTTGEIVSRKPWLLFAVNLVVVVGLGIMGFVFPETAFAGEKDSIPTITVLVFNYSSASPAILEEAEREAGRIFGKAGLRVVWLGCTISTGSAQGPCQSPLKATDLMLRIVCVPIRSSFHDTVFGSAVPPAIAAAYYEYVLRQATRDNAESEAPIILGYVMAHEIGHLLLGSNSHSAAGIMRPQWESNQLQQLMMGTLLFTTEQSVLMREQGRKRIRLQAGTPDSGLLPQSK